MLNLLKPTLKPTLFEGSSRPKRHLPLPSTSLNKILFTEVDETKKPLARLASMLFRILGAGWWRWAWCFARLQRHDGASHHSASALRAASWRSFALRHSCASRSCRTTQCTALHPRFARRHDSASHCATAVLRAATGWWVRACEAAPQ